MAKQWKVIGTDTVYDLKEDGTGTKDDDGLTFECGFDEDNNITIKITMIRNPPHLHCKSCSI